MTKEDTSKSLSERLINVQMKLNAPKSQYNSFGKYNYRNVEDILEAAKPLLQAEGLLLTINDEIVLIGDRYYVKATASISGWFDYPDAPPRGAAKDHMGVVSVSAYAREADDKKGMDAAQVTGATSSYARKYALNGLFAIDDAKDADTDEHRRQVDNAPRTDKLGEAINSVVPAKSGSGASTKQMDYLRSLMEQAGIDKIAIDAKLATIDSSEAASVAIEKMKEKLGIA